MEEQSTAAGAETAHVALATTGQEDHLSLSCLQRNKSIAFLSEEDLTTSADSIVGSQSDLKQHAELQSPDSSERRKTGNNKRVTSLIKYI